MYDICIIGGGPAGISSAIYSASRGLKTVVLEKKAVGGLLGSVSTVTHYSGIVEGETGKKQVRQAATAVSDGAVAAINAAAYVKSM